MAKVLVVDDERTILDLVRGNRVRDRQEPHLAGPCLAFSAAQKAA